jgi:hypothetical protein
MDSSGFLPNKVTTALVAMIAEMSMTMKNAGSVSNAFRNNYTMTPADGSDASR